MPLVVHHHTVKAKNNWLGNCCRWFVDFSVVLTRTCNNVRGHIAIITETKSTYVMIESTLWFNDVEVVPGLLPLLRVVQRSRMWSRERSGRWPGNEARYGIVVRAADQLMHNHLRWWGCHSCPAAITEGGAKISHAQSQFTNIIIINVLWAWIPVIGSQIYLAIHSYIQWYIKGYDLSVVVCIVAVGKQINELHCKVEAQK